MTGPEAHRSPDAPSRVAIVACNLLALFLLMLPLLLSLLLLMFLLLLLLKRLLLPLIVVRLLQRRQRLPIRGPMDCQDCNPTTDHPTARAAAKRHCSLTTRRSTIDTINRSPSGDSLSKQRIGIFFPTQSNSATRCTVSSTSVSGNAPFRKSPCKHLPHRRQKNHRNQRSP